MKNVHFSKILKIHDDDFSGIEIGRRTPRKNRNMNLNGFFEFGKNPFFYKTFGSKHAVNILTSAVKRQPGFRRGTRRASPFWNWIYVSILQRLFHFCIIWCHFMKINFSVFQMYLALKWIVRQQKSISFDPEKLPYIFLIDFENFNVFHFSSFLLKKGDFVAMITFSVSFQKPPRRKPGLLWMVSEVLWEYELKRIHNFREIFIFWRKQNANAIFHDGSQLRAASELST